MAKLTGQELLNYCAEHYEDSKKDLVRGAGYIKDNGKTNYTAFYTAKLQALGTYNEPQPILGNEPKEYGAYISGRWIDLDVTITVEDIELAVATILQDSKEYIVSDWVGIPSFLENEKPDWSIIVEFLDIKENIHNDNKDAYQVICEHHCQVIAYDNFYDIYRGNYSTEAEFAKECNEGSLDKDSYLHNYINWQDVWEGEYKDDHVSISHSKGYYIFRHL